jgi:cobalt/nickel transport system ATP-binding protein
MQLVNALTVTKIIAAHDLEMILQTCRRALILDQGRVVADGPARELFADAALMEAHGLEVPHSLTAHGEGYRHHHAKPQAEEG